MSRPDVGQQVDVVVAGRDTLDARVEETRDDTLRLTLLEGAAAPAGTTASLHFTNRRGICSVDGRIASTEGTSVWFAAAGRARLIQRRDHVRVAATIPVTYTPDGVRRHDAYTSDVSGGGFVIANPTGLTVGGTTHFTLHLDDEPLEAFGTAVRTTEDGGLAISLDVIAPGARERLIHWIFRRERLARAYARGR